MSASVACEGPHGIREESVRLVREGINARVVGYTLDADDGDLVSGTFFVSGPYTGCLSRIDWLPGDEFAAITRVSMMVEEDIDPFEPITGPGYYELKRRRCVFSISSFRTCSYHRTD